MTDQPRAVVLLSGGLDSATTLALAASDGFAVHALTFAYGQRHTVEVAAAREVAAAASVTEHVVVGIDLRMFGGSALTGDTPVPAASDVPAGAIPITYVPARNTILLAYALAYAETAAARAIYIGVNALDHASYPDCRLEYIAAFQALAALATRDAVEGQPVDIRAPLLHLTKAETIRIGLALGVDYTRTTSCYDPTPVGAPCRRCDACVLRAEGFSLAGVPDPAID